MFVMTLKSTFRRFWPLQTAHAHCDIPCGIYDPIAAKIAAQTVQKMVLRIEAAAPPSPSSSAEDRRTALNTISRYIAVKEEHAQLVKKELDILWHDYFRPDHLEKYPDLHAKFWQATKLAAANKQSVNMESAKQLVAAVDEIAEMFWDSKGVKYEDALADTRFGT
ncbi:MAG: superoxide dismutase, Ni [Chloroflexi bacterium]|nr:superoxide dismutase, Ni [Chloroflexota bacterium]